MGVNRCPADRWSVGNRLRGKVAIFDGQGVRDVGGLLPQGLVGASGGQRGKQDERGLAVRLLQCVRAVGSGSGRLGKVIPTTFARSTDDRTRIAKVHAIQTPWPLGGALQACGFGEGGLF